MLLVFSLNFLLKTPQNAFTLPIQVVQASYGSFFSSPPLYSSSSSYRSRTCRFLCTCTDNSGRQAPAQLLLARPTDAPTQASHPQLKEFLVYYIEASSQQQLTLILTSCYLAASQKIKIKNRFEISICHQNNLHLSAVIL